MSLLKPYLNTKVFSSDKKSAVFITLIHDLNKRKVSNENTMTVYTFLLFLFVFFHSNEEERTAVLVRKEETGAAVEGVEEGKRTQWNHLNQREINFWNANVGVDGLRGFYPACVAGL